MSIKETGCGVNTDGMRRGPRPRAPVPNSKIWVVHSKENFVYNLLKALRASRSHVDGNSFLLQASLT